MDSEFKPATDVSEFSDKKLGELLPAEKNKPTTPVKYNEKVIDTLEEDFEIARDTIIRILEESDSVIAGMMELAKESDSPRAYEVLGSIMNNFLNSADKLMDLHEKKAKVRERTGTKDPKVQNNTQNNYVFSGTPEDLFKVLEAKNKNE